ncbi:MAG: hypothetical protein HQ553_07105 [Chloroflexi bacterium]|nr:hypothetical protein [Chloroflexota bacterium]
MQICTKCILPATFPGIEYDHDGICNYCHDHEPMKVRGEEKLMSVLDKYKNKGDKYDCIVPISGGRDSSFVLHQMVRKYQMRVLALTVDSGFILPEGFRNIQNATEALGVPHVWLRDEKAIATAKKNTVLKFQGWLRNPSIHTIVPVLNSGDKTMNLRMLRHAKQNNIPVVMGGNFIGNCSFEQEHWKRGYLGVYADDRGAFSTRDKTKLVFLFGMEYLKNPSNFKYPIFREYVTGGSVYFFERLFRPNGVDSLGFYDYIYWKEDEVLSTVRNELGWEGAADHTTTWRIDDSAYPLINYIYFRLVGFTEHDEMYSKMIRENVLTREEALQRVSRDHQSEWIHGARLRDSLEELGVTKEQLDKALDAYKEILYRTVLKKRCKALTIGS